MRARIWAAAFACASIAAAIAMWGFTVDDALISIRYARHLVSGAGYRFNATGLSTDGVTPLPWPFVIAPLSFAAPLVVLARVKVLDILLHAASAALVGTRSTSTALGGRLTALAALAVCMPFAAYGASGMDTPLATLLCTLCVFCMNRADPPKAGRRKHDRAYAPIFAGIAASIRPELLPWAATISCGLALAQKKSARVVIASTLIATAPFVLCAIVRRVAFGHFAPLAISAKPSDLTHGAMYVAAALVACALPLLVIAPMSLRVVSREAQVIVVAFVVHIVAVAFAGGDSMPYARLFVPLLPSLLFVHLEIASIGGRKIVLCLRSAATITIAIVIAVTAAPRGRRVMAERASLIARAEPVLASAHRVAAVDIGWISAAWDGPIVDLAGLTDPEIAALPGGHTSKRVDGSMLLDRDVDTIVLWAAQLPDEWGHVTSARLARDRIVVDHYARSAELPLGVSGAGYVVLTRKQ